MADDDSFNLDSSIAGSDGDFAYSPSYGSPISQAVDAILAGPGHPGYSDPLVRPWIDLMSANSGLAAGARPQLLAMNGGPGQGPLQADAQQQSVVNFAQSHLGDGWL